MNGVETRSPEREQTNTLQGALSGEKRTIIAEKRRKRKRARKLKNLITILLCTIIIAGCAVVIAKITLEERDNAIYISGNNPAENTAEDNSMQNIYSAFPYYKEDNLQRYEEYNALNPQMQAEDVVWMVNSNQDKPKYGYDIPVSGYDDLLIIVNKYYKVPDDYRPDNLVKVDGQLVRAEAAEAFKKMQSDALAEGLKIRAVSGYRTVEYQRGLYNRYLSSDSQENVDRYSARPGYSEHHTGLAIDIFGSVDGLRQFENTPEYPWVRDNCYKYGFIIRYFEETESITGYESEPWHIRYVGAEVSTDMKEKNINSFEEYHAKYLLQ